MPEPIKINSLTAMKQKNRITINSADSLSNAVGLLRETFRERKYFQIQLFTGKKRSLNQNALQHVWYHKVSVEEGEYSPEGVKCLCKYHFGLPILRGEDEQYNQTCIDFIDPLLYDKRIEAMKFFPVTSLMTTIQLSRYMEHVQHHYSGRVTLEFAENGN